MALIDFTMGRLEDQIAWYDSKSGHSQRRFKWLKGIEIGAAAFVPLAAGFALPAWLTGGLGVVVVILEGLQHLNQYQYNWITYRSTCEALKHEKYLYLAKAGDYAIAKDADVLLAEKTEGLISQENSKWVAGREEASRERKPDR